jgi:hypothetical protein
MKATRPPSASDQLVDGYAHWDPYDGTVQTLIYQRQDGSHYYTVADNYNYAEFECFSDELTLKAVEEKLADLRTNRWVRANEMGLLPYTLYVDALEEVAQMKRRRFTR